MSSWKDLPPSFLAKLETYRDQEDGVTPEVLTLWHGWVAEAIHAANELKTAKKQRFQEPEFRGERTRLSAKYLHGEGIEIGALHNPLEVPEQARVCYVDMCDTDHLHLLYPEVSFYEFVDVDIVDNGERLAAIGDASQDFAISNHFLEHCENPILAIQNKVRVLKPGGLMYMAVPDCRNTFDSERARTTLEHVWSDYEGGPSASRQVHYQDWSTKVSNREGLEHDAWWRMLDALDYSIHYHVWEPRDVLEMVLDVNRRLQLGLEILEFVVHGEECVIIARKAAAKA